MTSTVLFSEQDVAAAVERLKCKARREVTERVAADYLARGGTVPPTDDTDIEVLLTTSTQGAYRDLLDKGRERAAALTDEELEAIHAWYEEAYFQSASREDYEADDRSEAVVEYLDKVLAELNAPTLASLVEEAVERTRAWARREMKSWPEQEAADDAVVRIAAALGVAVEPMPTIIEFTITAEDIGDDDFVDVAVAHVLRHAEDDRVGEDAPEVKRITPADAETWIVHDVQAVDPASLAHVEGILVLRVPGLDSMGLPRVDVVGPTRKATVEYVRAQWGDEDAQWFADYIEARCERVEQQNYVEVELTDGRTFAARREEES